jgi:AcrR family transcriptional regulator
VRADAKRNRDRIVEAAREVYREHGYDAPLDLVAKRAGVGAGTLYRHFPSRDVLVDAVMQGWIDRVTEATEKVLAFEGPDRDLLLAWFDTYVGLVSLHKGGPAKITRAMGDCDSPIRSKCGVLSGAAGRVIDVLVERGSLREGTDPVQMCRMVGGVASIAEAGELDEPAVRSMLEVLADGMLAQR